MCRRARFAAAVALPTSPYGGTQAGLIEVLALGANGRIKSRVERFRLDEVEDATAACGKEPSRDARRDTGQLRQADRGPPTSRSSLAGSVPGLAATSSSGTGSGLSATAFPRPNRPRPCSRRGSGYIYEVPSAGRAASY